MRKLDRQNDEIHTYDIQLITIRYVGSVDLSDLLTNGSSHNYPPSKKDSEVGLGSRTLATDWSKLQFERNKEICTMLQFTNETFDILIGILQIFKKFALIQFML